MLSEEQVGSFANDGYVRIPGVFSEDDVETLRCELDELIQTWAATTKGWTGPWRQVYMSPDVEQRSMLTALHDLHFYSAACFFIRAEISGLAIYSGRFQE